MKPLSPVASLSAGVLLLIVLCVLGYERLGSRTDHVSIYVAVRSGETNRFIDRFVVLMRGAGLDSSTGHATDDQGKVRTVVEAIGGNSRVWMTNVPLSGEETAPECTKHFEAYPDPEQFEIRVRTRFRLLPGGRVPKLVDEIGKHLDKEGLQHRKVPWLCGAVAFGMTAGYLIAIAT